MWDSARIIKGVAIGRLSRPQIEQVLRRAAELEANRDAALATRKTPGDTGLSEQDVLRLGEEAGLSESSLQNALAELRRGQLSTVERDSLDRALGSRQIVVSREVPGPGRPRAPRDRALPARAADDGAAPPRRPGRVGAGAGPVAGAGPLARLCPPLRLRPGHPRRDGGGGGGRAVDLGDLPDRPQRAAPASAAAGLLARGGGVLDLRPRRGAVLPGLRSGGRRLAAGGGRRRRRSDGPRAPPLRGEPGLRHAGARAFPGPAGRCAGSAPWWRPPPAATEERRRSVHDRDLDPAVLGAHRGREVGTRGLLAPMPTASSRSRPRRGHQELDDRLGLLLGQVSASSRGRRRCPSALRCAPW